MNKKIIYLKEVDSYDDILKKEYKKLPLFFKKIIFLIKNIFNIVTKKSEEEYNVWIIPIKEKYSNDKLEKILKKNLKINNFLIHNNPPTISFLLYLKSYYIITKK